MSEASPTACKIWGRAKRAPCCTQFGIYIYKQWGSLRSPPAAPDSDTFHHIATYLHTYTCTLYGVVNWGYERSDLASGGGGACFTRPLLHPIRNIYLQAVGLASLAPCCTRFGYLPSHSYISAHIHMHTIWCCKLGL